MLDNQFLQAGEMLADQAGLVIRSYFRTPVVHDRKQDLSPVTIADCKAEKVMRDLLKDWFPGHGILGEEFGEERSDSPYLWVLDPIDGTRSFLTGKPLFGTLIALLYEGEPVLGILDQPVMGERWIGRKGQTSVFNKKNICTRTVSAVDQLYLATTSPHLFTAQEFSAFSRLGSCVRDVLYGGDCYNYGLLSSGFIDLVVEAQMKLHDFAALVPIIEGAGGIVCDWQGNRLAPYHSGQILALGTPALLPEICSLLEQGQRNYP